MSDTLQILSIYMKKQLGLVIHLMSTVLLGTMLGGWGSKTLFLKTRWEAGWLVPFGSGNVGKRANIGGLSFSGSVGFQVNIRNS